MGKSTISMAIFNCKLLVHQRVDLMKNPHEIPMSSEDDVRATKHWDQNSERMELADLKGVCMLVLETFNLGNPSKRLDTYGYSQSPCMVAARNRYVQSLCWCFNTPAMNTSKFFWGRFDYVYLGIGCGLTNLASQTCGPVKTLGPRWLSELHEHIYIYAYVY